MVPPPVPFLPPRDLLLLLLQSAPYTEYLGYFSVPVHPSVQTHWSAVLPDSSPTGDHIIEAHYILS